MINSKLFYNIKIMMLGNHTENQHRYITLSLIIIKNNNVF